MSRKAKKVIDVQVVYSTGGCPVAIYYKVRLDNNDAFQVAWWAIPDLPMDLQESSFRQVIIFRSVSARHIPTGLRFTPKRSLKFGNPPTTGKHNKIGLRDMKLSKSIQTDELFTPEVKEVKVFVFSVTSLYLHLLAIDRWKRRRGRRRRRRISKQNLVAESRVFSRPRRNRR